MSFLTIKQGVAQIEKRTRYYRRLKKTPDCCFVWIPKAAGTSVFEWLARELGMIKLKNPNDFYAFPNHGAVTFGHVHYLSLLLTGVISNDYHSSSYKFAITRDPYTRTVSLYNYLYQLGVFTKSFDHFVDEVALRRPPVGIYHSIGLSQTNPQVDWVIDHNGELVVDELFKVEAIAEFESKIQNALGFQAKEKLGAKNVSKKQADPNKGSVFNASNIEVINEIYRRDFAIFDYPIKTVADLAN